MCAPGRFLWFRFIWTESNVCDPNQVEVWQMQISTWYNQKSTCVVWTDEKGMHVLSDSCYKENLGLPLSRQWLVQTGPHLSGIWHNLNTGYKDERASCASGWLSFPFISDRHTACQNVQPTAKLLWIQLPNKLLQFSPAEELSFSFSFVQKQNPKV